MWPFSESNTSVVAAKREQRARALVNNPVDVSKDQHQYIRATATDIVAHIERGEWTASEVLEAFIARAVLAQAKTNCLTEVMFDWARQQAKELDAEFALTGKLRGPLHGVPVSIKEQFEIKGYDASTGYSQWANKPATSNADVVDLLLASGAIIYVKTNIPQTMFAFECSNPVFGRTTNPYNNQFTCGGSSGGEAALLSMDGSALGIGSDIGGSLRIPTAYCGIYSLKPSADRLSHEGARSPSPGFEGIKTVVGPMGRSVKDLSLFARIAFGVSGASHTVAPVPFRDVQLPKKLRFGYYTSDCYIKASPANKRAVLETVEALRKQGHECVEFQIPNISEGVNVFVGLTSSDGYKTMLNHLGPDTKENALFLVTLGPKLPSFVRNIAGWVLESFMGDKIFADTLRITRAKPMEEYMHLVERRNAYTDSFYKNVWDKYKFDAIIAPVQAVPQLPHGGCDNFIALASATVLYSLLDLPVACLPVTRVDPAKDQLTDEWVKGPGLGSAVIESGLYRSKNPIYNPQASAGMPVNVQIIGKKWEDEKTLAIMDIVDNALGTDRGFGPGAWDAHMNKVD